VTTTAATVFFSYQSQYPNTACHMGDRPGQWYAMGTFVHPDGAVDLVVTTSARIIPCPPSSSRALASRATFLFYMAT
jgi:hypothetical protein